MATKDLSSSPLSDSPVGVQTTYSWSALATGDDGAPVTPIGSGPLAGAVQFTGTFAGGTTAVLEGTVDGTNWATLKDLQGDAISVTAAGIVEFSTAVAQFRPSVSGGASDSVDVTVVTRG